MEELFRLKIAAKRQVTLPQRLLNALHLSEGDEIRLQVNDGQIAAVEACKVVPTRLFTPEVLKELAVRESEIAAGNAVEIDPEEVAEGTADAMDPGRTAHPTYRDWGRTRRKLRDGDFQFADAAQDVTEK